MFSQASFQPIPDSLKSFYKFNLNKNFFQSNENFNFYLNEFGNSTNKFRKKLTKKATDQNIENLTKDLSQLEYDFRKMDLYLFLKFAINTANEKAIMLEDSIYEAMVEHRNAYKNYINSASQNTIKSVLSRSPMNHFHFYINKIITNKKHELTEPENTLIKPFNYLKNNRFYDEFVNQIPTNTIIKQMTPWIYLQIWEIGRIMKIRQ